jgi:hypothetical protein
LTPAIAALLVGEPSGTVGKERATELRAFLNATSFARRAVKRAGSLYTLKNDSKSART